MFNADDISLVVGLVTSKAEKQWKNMADDMKNDAESKSTGLSQAFNSTAASVAGIGVAATAAFTVPVIQGLIAATMKAAEFETAISNAARTLDIDGAQKIKAFSDEILNVAPKLGLLPQEFAEIAGEAGKLGVASNEVVKFGEILSNLATITDVPVDKFTTKMGAIKTIFKLNIDEMEAFGAALNAIDDKVGGTSLNISNFVARVGATANQVGLTAEETAAFGAVFEKVGIPAERASTAMETFAQTLFTVKNQSKDTKEALGKLGVDAKELEGVFQNPDMGAWEAFDYLISEAAGKTATTADRMEVMGNLLEVFGKASSSEIAVLVNNYDELAKAIDVARDKQGAMNKMQSELAKKQDTFAFQWQVFQSQLQTVAILVGQSILPLIKTLLQVVNPLIAKLINFMSQNPLLTQWIVGIAAVLAILIPIVTVVAAAVAFFPLIVGGFAAITGALPFVALGLVGIIGAIFILKAAWAGLQALWKLGGLIISGLVNTFRGLALIFTGGLIPSFLRAGGTLKGFTVIVGLATALTFGWIPAIIAMVAAWMNFDWVYTNVIRKIPFLATALRVVGDAFNRFQGWVYNAAKAVYRTFTEIGEWLWSLDWSAIGMALMDTLTFGLASKAASAVKVVADTMAQVRNYLPSSPAKMGALQDLDKVGGGFMGEIAKGIANNPLAPIVNTQMANSVPTRGASPSGGGSGVAGGGGINVTIQINGNVTNSTLEELKRNQRAFADLLRETQYKYGNA